MLVKLTCTQCLSRFKIEFMEPHPTIGAYKYCPACSSTQIVIDQFTNEEYSFEVLSQAYGIPSIMLERIYALWIQDPTRPTPYLKDYIIQELEKLVPAKAK